MHNLRERLAFVKGLAQFSRTNETEQEQLIRSELFALLEDLVNEIERISQGQSPNARRNPRGNNGESHANSAESPEDSLTCPSCRRRLIIPGNLLALESFEVTCPDCSVVLEVT